MTLTHEQLAALNLPSDATAEQVVARALELAAASAPKADNSQAAAIARLETLVAGLVEASKAKPEPTVAPNATEATEAHKIAVNAVVDAAVASGKVAPASREAFIAQGGTTTESLKGLQSLIAALPVLVATNASAPKSAPSGGGAVELTAGQKRICASLGISEDEFRKSRSELK